MKLQSKYKKWRFFLMANRTPIIIKKLRYRINESMATHSIGLYKKQKKTGSINDKRKQSGTKCRKDKAENFLVNFTVKIFHNPLL